MITFNAEEVCLPKNIGKTTEVWIEKCIGEHKLHVGEVAVIFCSDEYLLKINQEYLKHDYYTDVITFDYREHDIISGDIFISVERVEDNATSLNLSMESELHRVLIHGVLHLCGYKDKTDEDKKVMTEQEDRFLAMMGI